MTRIVLIALSLIALGSAQAEFKVGKNIGAFKSVNSESYSLAIMTETKVKSLDQLDQNSPVAVSFSPATTPLNFKSLKLLWLFRRASDMAKFNKSDDTLWLSPIQAIEGDPRESDPQIGEQLHHAPMQNFEAWQIEEGSEEIVVAVTDDGVDIHHPDLKNRIWINDREIPGNGKDDDGNGYIDDVKGWDFSDNDADPSQGANHGTHVAGIIVAEKGNNVGLAGTAPNVRVMPLRFYGGRRRWNSNYFRVISMLLIMERRSLRLLLISMVILETLFTLRR